MRKLLSSIALALVVLSCQNPTVSEQTYVVDGSIQKGPFQLGSKITIQSLTKDLEPAGNVYNTTTTDDFGSFALASALITAYVEVEAEGYYFNECTGVTADAKITLRSYSELKHPRTTLQEKNQVHLNVLTTITHGRIKKLVESGVSFSDARDQAEQELLASLGFDSVEGLHFYDYNLESGGYDAAMLLAFSAALQKGRDVSDLSLLIADLNIDLAVDGIIDNATSITKIRTGAEQVNVSTTVNNLRTHYSYRGKAVEVPDFSNYCLILRLAGGTIAAPILSLDSGTYIEAQQIAISAPPGSEIRYTLNGSTPDRLSTLYTTAINLPVDGSTVTIKAISILNNIVSSVTTGTFVMKNGRKGSLYIANTPGKYIEYDFNGYRNINTSLSCKFYAVTQAGKNSNPYNTTIDSNFTGPGFAQMASPITGQATGSFKSGSFGAWPYLGTYLYILQSLPETVIFGQTYSAESITYTPTLPPSWNSFTDLIKVTFDSTEFSSTAYGSGLPVEVQGTGYFLYAKGVGLVYFEITHSAGSNPGQKETLTYANAGDALPVVFTGTLTIGGLDAIGYTVSSGIYSSHLPNEALANLTSSNSFSISYYAVPGSYFTLRRYKTSDSTDTRKFRVLIPSTATTLVLGDVGSIDNFGIITP